MQRVVLTTGGTGGHIFPALAVAEELQAAFPNIEILFIGAQYGPEKKLAEQAGLSFVGLPVRGLLGRGFKAVGAACAMTRAVFSAYRVIKQFNPELVAGFGGYASFAPVLASKLMHIPTLLHEQNAVAGTGNRVLGKIVDKICLSMPVESGFSREKCVITGNPIRRCISELKKDETAFSQKHLLVMGGSLGAHAINEYIMGVLPELRKAGVEILHQTGVKDEAVVREAYIRAGYEASSVTAFIDDMAQAYSWASLVFCRSGATTVAELSAAGLPAVFVPFPFAIHDHQTFNAQCMGKSGAAVLIAEKALADFETSNLIDLCTNASRLQGMGKASAQLAHRDAALKVVREMTSLINR